MLLAAILLFFGDVAHAQACPHDMQEINDFCIDRYEAPNKEGEKPLIGRTALDAEKWCRVQGKELCTDVQWQSACEGRERRLYPYGGQYHPHVCNDDKIWRVPNWQLVAKYDPTNPQRTPEATAHINYLNQSEPAGIRPGCSTIDGVFDLTGNAAEWVRNTRRAASNADGKVYAHNIRGCYWAKCYGGAAPSCRFNNANHASAFRSYETGFRCCLKIFGEIL